MPEKGLSGLMSGDGKRATARRPRTAPVLDSTFRREEQHHRAVGAIICPIIKTPG